jgi:hypothetical protein
LAFAFNLVVSSLVISIAAWLSRRAPSLAGFIVALPLASLVALPLSYHEHGDVESSILLTKSIFIAIPVSLTFFLPFLFAGRLGLSFWQAYGLGAFALPVGFVVHRIAIKVFFG